MLALFHAPYSRSARVLTLIEEMGIGDEIAIRPVRIPRQDGSGGRDPANPHPEGKSPCLVHDGEIITETGAILLYLTDLFPGTGLGPLTGEPGRGEYLTWLSWYQGVLEPVLICQSAGIAHDWLTAAIRGPAEAGERLRRALERGPWLLGESYSAADLLVHSPYGFFPEVLPDDPLIRYWAARCAARPAGQRVLARDAEMMARAA